MDPVFVDEVPPLTEGDRARNLKTRFERRLRFLELSGLRLDRRQL